MNDLALLDGVRRFDPQALTEAHDRYYRSIFRYIAFKVGNLETAEDLTSEVFVRLLDAVQDCRTPNKSLQGWLICVASHIVNDFFRKKYAAKQNIELTETIASDSSSPIEQIIQKQNLDELRAALEQLTDDQQKVISLRFGYGMSIKDAAIDMGKSEAAVKQLQARAVAALTRLMTH
jgi:RNA polymerase sigma-70 factor (ECF subfamily)